MDPYGGAALPGITQVLKDDKRAVFMAASRAQKASDFPGVQEGEAA